MDGYQGMTVPVVPQRHSGTFFSKTQVRAPMAIGARTWVLLKKVPEWRWGTTGTVMPWYPSMRLFRQGVRGDWSGPVGEIAAALEAAANSFRKI